MKKIIIFVLIATVFSSCKNLVPYTDSLQKQHKWTADQLKNAQFYLSEDVTLERQLVKDMPDHISGKITVENGVRKEVIFLQKKLPVVLIDTTSTGAYTIQCESGDGKTLNFKVNPSTGKFVLLATEWKNGYGKLHYNQEEYYVSTEQATAHLLVDQRASRDKVFCLLQRQRLRDL